MANVDSRRNPRATVGFEGVLTSGAASTTTAQAVQANIVAAGYGN